MKGLSDMDGHPSSAGSGAALFRNVTLSVVIRVTEPSELGLFDETLFSLSLQYWHDVEVVVVLSGGTDEARAAVFDLAERQPWPVSPALKVVSAAPVPGVGVRSALGNVGIEQAVGRFLTFLDGGDTCTHHGFDALVRRLIGGERALAVGGHLRAHVSRGCDGHLFVGTQDSFPWRPSRNVFRVRKAPINATVIDRSRLGGYALRFDEALHSGEDADFLSRLRRNFPPDLSAKGIPVCRYAERLSGLDRVAYGIAVRAYRAAGALPPLRVALRGLFLGAGGTSNGE